MVQSTSKSRLAPRPLALALGILSLAGCLSPVRQQVDTFLSARADSLSDPMPASADKKAARSESAGLPELPAPRALDQPAKTLEQRLKIPAGVPGADTPRLTLPAEQPLEGGAKKYFPPLAPLALEAEAAPGPGGKPLSLGDLQRLARAHSPLLRQAAADIEAAKGGAIQSRLYPNPTLGTSSYTFGPGGGPYYGLAGSATIKTMGKLKLAYAAAEMNVKNAELAYRKAETDLMTQVRTYYFAVLVAQESMRAHRALVQLADELYRVMAAQFRGGDRAVYEPMQVGVLASQARANFLMARNSGQLAWKQLASSLGLPAMPPTQLEGRADMPLPRFEYDKALARVLALHTDVATTGNSMQRARYNLRLAEVAPFSDIVIAGSLMQDATPPTFGPNRVIWNGLQGVASVPLFDRNQGGIEQAQGSLLRAVEEPHRVRAELTGRFAEAFRRYDENRALLDLYRTAILPQQVQAFRAAVKRHYGAGAKQVAYTDLIQSEQSLVAVVGTYLMILGAEWQAVVDVAGFLQTDDLFQLAEGTYPSAVPELHQLLELPCCHPCGAPPGVGVAGTSSWLPSALSLGQRD